MAGGRLRLLRQFSVGGGALARRDGSGSAGSLRAAATGRGRRAADALLIAALLAAALWSCVHFSVFRNKARARRRASQIGCRSATTLQKSRAPLDATPPLARASPRRASRPRLLAPPRRPQLSRWRGWCRHPGGRTAFG